MSDWIRSFQLVVFFTSAVGYFKNHKQEEKVSSKLMQVNLMLIFTLDYRCLGVDPGKSAIDDSQEFYLNVRIYYRKAYTNFLVICRPKEKRTNREI